MSKTPISTLQEYMAKNVLGLPVYDLVAETTGTHNPSFTYRVKCGKESALGTASNKKEAKHNAARELLISLDLYKKGLPTIDKAVAQGKVTSVNSYYGPGSNAITENEIFVNSVGKLSEHCVQHKLLNPQYEVRNMSGPSHNMSFTMTCTIGKLTAQATATTKKQAKHDAAQSMLRILMGGAGNKHEISKYAEIEDKFTLPEFNLLDLKIEEPKRPLVKSSELAKDLYPQLRLRGAVKVVKNIEVSEYHRALGESIDPDKRETLRRELAKKSLSFPECEILAQISKIMNTKVQMTTLVGNVNGWAVDCKLDSIPVLAEIGIGSTLHEAETKAMSNLLSTIHNFLI